MRSLEIDLFTEHSNIALDPILAYRLNLHEVCSLNLSLVREVEPKFRWRDERALLVNMIAQDLTKTIVQNVRSSVIVAKRPAAQL